MKILFVSSGNSKAGISPIISSQGDSLSITDAKTVIEYFLIKGKGIRGYISSISKLRKSLKTNKFDIIHAHYFLSAAVASLAGARPLVVSLMGSDVKAKSWYKWVIYIFSRFLWAKTIVKSEDMKKSLGFNDANVIPNGVSLDKFQPLDQKKCQEKLKWKKNKRHILFPSNPERPEKNIELALDAIKRISLGNTEFHILNNISNKDVPFYLNSSDVILLTSKWEGSPNVIKEAMACNIPIVSTDVGDVSEIIKGIDGCYLTSFNAIDVTEKLEIALEFDGRTNGRARIVSTLDDRIIASKLIKIYESIQ